MSLRRNIGNITSDTQTDASILLNAISEPQLMPGIQVATPVTSVFTPSDVAPTNSTPVATIAATPATGNTLLYLGLGAGALFLLTRKKKKKGVSGTDKKKSMMPVLLIGGAAAAWYFYSQSQSTAVNNSSVVTTTDPTTGAVTTVPVVQTGITVNPATAITLPSDAQIYNQLYAYSVPWRYAVDRMTIAEKQALYTYVYAYLQKGLRLYGYAGVYQDGFYDLNLFNTIKALSSKWNLGLLN